ncbi:hypothetical protein BSKO_05827 [Bryopsis sp. KO-2023]|nr:hypothetical protein BSKO_05827 [Bryopsis sp. KO-2023]
MSTSSGRFSPNSFQYNGRVALAFVPSLVVLGGLAGKFVVGTLMVGAMVAYISDMLRWREAAIGSIWFTLVVSNLGFLIGSSLQADRPLLLSLGMIGVVGATLMITGIWATVQFKWIQLKHPAVVIALERLLMVACLPVGLVVQTLGVAGAVGLGNAPFFMMAMGCILYYLCMVPLPSSFQRGRVSSIGGASRSTSHLQGRLDGLIASITITFLPGFVYFVSHFDIIFESEHFWSLALLWSTPVLFICALPEGLWWISERPQGQHAFRVILIAVSGIVAIAGLEFRVIFHSFGQYIPMTPPWSWLLVGAFMYMKAAIVGAHFAGLLNSQAGFIFGGGALIVAAGAGGVVAGLPLPLMPCPLIGAAGMALYYDSRQLRDYVVFLAGTAAAAIYLFYQHFWFLEVSVGGVSVRGICQLAIAALVVSLIVPGIVLSGVGDGVVKIGLEAFLLIQGLVLSLLEERLYAGEHDEGDVIYPAYLVLFTSILGVGIARRLEEMEYINSMCAYILQCMYIAKLPMLLLPEASLVVPAFAVALAVSPPYLLLKAEAGGRQPRLHPWQGVVLVAAVVFSMTLARFAIFDIIQEFVSPHPPEGLLFGALLISIAAGSMPMVFRCYPNSQAARRSLILVTAAGVLLCVLRPPFPITGGSKCPQLPFGFCPRLWDERHVPGHEMDDVEIYGLGLARREHWPMWMIVVALMMGLAAATSGIPVHRSVKTRLGYAAVGGLSAGAYLALEFFPGQPPLQILVLIATLLACAFLVLLQKPAEMGGSSWMPILAALWGVLLPITMFIQSETPIPELSRDMQRLYPDGPRQVQNERRMAGRAALLAIYAAQSLLLAFALKLKVSNALRSNGAAAPQSRALGGGNGLTYGGNASWRAMCGPGGFSVLFGSMIPPKVLDRIGRMTKMDGAAGLMLRRLSAEGLGWVPTVGNLMTIASFSICMILNLYFTGGGPEAAFVLVPILLLLNQDPLLLPGLTERQRYFPPYLALVGYLWMLGLWSLAQAGIFHPEVYLAPTDSAWWYLLRNAVMMLVTLPNLVSFLGFLWSQKLKSDATLLIATPLNVLPLAFSELTAIKLIGLAGGAGAIIEFFSMRHIQRIGMRLI